MKSYSTLRALYGTLTNNSTSANLTLGDQLINDYIRQVMTGYDWSFLNNSATLSTIASQQFYQLPKDCAKLVDVTITDGTTVYTPREVPSRQMWDRINQQTNFTANAPEYYFLDNRSGSNFGSQVGFWPIPSSTGLTVTMNYKRTLKDLTIPDYSTGTISAVSSLTVTGSGTSWGVGMAGSFIRITDGFGAGSGDGFWYEIQSVSNSTTIILEKAYQGVALVAASAAYTIGQMPLLPEPYHILPVYGAVATYWEKEGEPTYAQEYSRLYNELLTDMKAEYGSKTTDPGVDIGLNDVIMINPNLTIST